ncbi:head-tail connector protein [Sphingopyxis sp.]|uniref:head-tail connector protein n=1 Tax=Sphingopyxis sp. TaxID=1908224 RepID=UPI003D10C420
MTMSLVPGESPVSLTEARGWLRMGTAVDDAVVAQLLRAATSICEAFVGQWLVRRSGSETLPLDGGTVRLTVRPVVAVADVTLLAVDGGATVADSNGYRVAIASDGIGRLTINAPGDADRVRVTYRAGLAEDGAGVPEAIRQGIVRMTQHLYDARDGADAAPPAVIAALWQPWRTLSLGGGR